MFFSLLGSRFRVMVRLSLCEFVGGAATSVSCARAFNACCSNDFGVLDSHGGNVNSATFGTRVGSAIFAVGVGLAVAASPGTAAADTAESGQSSDSAPSTTSPAGAGSAKSERKPSAHTASPSPARNRPRSSLRPGSETSPPVKGQPPARRAVAGASSSIRHTSVRDDAGSANATALSDAPGSAETDTLGQSAVAVDTTVMDEIPPAATAPHASARLTRPSGVLSFLGLASSGASTEVPSTPMEFVTAVLEFIRREVKRLFFNGAPVAAPTLSGQSEPGIVTGSLNASDPDDDPLTYSVTQLPVSGTVVVDSDGSFTYTADEAMAAGGGSDTFVVTVRDTGFHLNFWAPSTAAVPVTVTVTGAGDPSPSAVPAASIADLSVTEGDGQHAHFMFTVTLSAQSDTAVTLHYATANGSATGGQDYAIGAGTVTFAPGVTTQTVHVDIIGDSVEESDETFTVTLSSPSGATISRATATGTIVDDDMTMPDPGGSGDYIDLATLGNFHGSDHTDHTALEGGRTAITTEALVAYNNLREFAGLAPATLEEVGTWAFSNQMTNNAQAWDNDLQGVGLFYAMQGAKVGWIADDKFDPQIVADIERTARLGSADDVMAMVAEYGHEGLADFLMDNGYDQAFIETLKMEPHYAGWMHDRAQGKLSVEGVATSHDVNHLTVLSHDQMQPFMNDTWDWPQWPALDVSHAGVIEYFQSMVSLGNPVGENLSDLDAPHSGQSM